MVLKKFEILKSYFENYYHPSEGWEAVVETDTFLHLHNEFLGKKKVMHYEEKLTEIMKSELNKEVAVSFLKHSDSQTYLLLFEEKGSLFLIFAFYHNDADILEVRIGILKNNYKAVAISEELEKKLAPTAKKFIEVLKKSSSLRLLQITGSLNVYEQF